MDMVNLGKIIVELLKTRYKGDVVTMLKKSGLVPADLIELISDARDKEYASMAVECYVEPYKDISTSEISRLESIGKRYINSCDSNSTIKDYIIRVNKLPIGRKYRTLKAIANMVSKERFFTS